jgi:hypothetical protein
MRLKVVASGQRTGAKPSHVANSWRCKFVHTASNHPSAARVTVCHASHISSSGGVLAGAPFANSSTSRGSRTSLCKDKKIALFLPRQVPHVPTDRAHWQETTARLFIRNPFQGALEFFTRKAKLGDEWMGHIDG